VSDRRADGRPRTLVVIASTRRRGAEIEGVQLCEELRRLKFEAEVTALVAVDAAGGLSVASLGRHPRSPVTLWRLRRMARRFDVVVAYGSVTLAACAIGLFGAKVPFIYRSIGDPERWVRGRVHRFRTGLLFRRAARVVALWPRAALSIDRLYGVPEDRLAVIPNARPAERFSPPTLEQRHAARRGFDIPVDAEVVASIGSLSGEKQVDQAIRAIADVPGAILLIAGGGPRRSELEALADELAPSRVRFVGDTDKPNDVLHASDLLLLTSRTEGMPGVVIEAGLCAIPAVSTPVGAIDELVEHGRSGHIVVEAAADLLAEAIRSVLPAAAEMGSHARTHMRERFTWESVAPRWDALLTEMASTRRPA
jgi:glycosyltransferase involved in cell wall biosynthesis